MSAVIGTIVINVTRTPNPSGTAIDLRIPPTEAAVLSRLLKRSGWNGTREALAGELDMTPSKLRAALANLETRHLVLQARVPGAKGWVWPIAATDTPGALPTAEELRATMRTGISTWTDADHPVTASMRVTIPAKHATVPTCDDALNPQVSPYAENTLLTGCLPSRPGRAALRGGQDQPVNRFAPLIPESPEVRLQRPPVKTSRYGVGVITSSSDLAKLAKRPVKATGDGGNYRTSAQVWEAARTLDLDMVDASLATLAALDLPFWVAPDVWPLLERGWSTDRVSMLLADVFHTANRPDRMAIHRLTKALAEEDAPPAPEALESPAVARGADGADFVDGAAPWDRYAGEKAAAAAGVVPPGGHRFGGFRAPAVPTPPTMDDVRAKRDELRAGHVVDRAPELGRSLVDQFKALRATAKGSSDRKPIAIPAFTL